MIPIWDFKNEKKIFFVVARDIVLENSLFIMLAKKNLAKKCKIFVSKNIGYISKNIG